jgi:hypothetical protein
MLLIDGVKYEEWTPKTEDEFEHVVKEHANDIFGEQSIYLDIKQKLKSRGGIGSKPNGYVIVFGEQPHWHIVEVELSSHPLYDHIVPQIGRFISGIKNPSSQREIVDALFHEIDSDEFRRLQLKKAIGATETYKFLAELVSRPPVVAIIIEKRTDQLDEAIGALAHTQIKVVELRTFAREGVGVAVHAHLFEPLVIPPEKKRDVEREEDVKERGTKRKRVKLEELVVEGLLKDGQLLHFYHADSYRNEQAQVVASENKLKYEADGKLYSASELAQILSKKYGLPNGRHDVLGRNWGVSGPKYWKTEDGKLLYDLFQKWKISKGGRR